MITDCVANGNGSNGFDSDCEGDVTFTNLTANNNTLEGLEVEVDGNCTISNCTTMNNGLEGIHVDEETVGNLVDNLTIQNVVTMGNRNCGIVSTPGAEPVRSDDTGTRIE